MRLSFSKKHSAGIALVEALIYIACLLVFLSIVAVSTWRLFSSQVRLTERSDRLVKVLNVGEQWREAVRQSEKHPVSAGDGIAFVLGDLPVTYDVTGESIIRKSGGNDEVLVSEVASSRMQRIDRKGVVYWRWDLEVRLNRDRSKTQSFTFMAVPAKQPNP